MTTQLHPGVCLIAAVAAAAILEKLFPASVDVPLPIRVSSSGIALMAGAVVIFWAINTLQNAGTPIEPHREPSSLVTSGPFRFSRNPMYVGNLLLIFGFVCLTGSMWFVVANLAQFAVLNQLVIPREEASLRRSFPNEAIEWVSRTPRWLWPSAPRS